LNHSQTPSIEEVIGETPSKGWCKTGKYKVLNLGLIKEVKVEIMRIN